MTLRKFRRAVSGAAAAGLALSGMLLVTQPASADAGLLAHYPLDETSGEVAADVSGAGRDGSYVGSPSLTGGAGVRLDGEDDHVQLPDDILAGLDSVTISAEVLVRGTQRTPYFIYGFGNTDGSGVGDGYLFTSGDSYRASIASGNWSTEQTVDSDSDLPRDRWQTITYALDGATDTARLYLDGVEVAQSTDITLTPGEIGEGSTTANYLGRSVYTADNHLAGSLRNVRIYDAALPEAQVAALVPSDETRVERDAAGLSLGDLSAVTADLDLPETAVNGSTVTWSSSDEDVITTTGTVTRPAADEAAVEVTLSATLTSGTAADPVELVATVLPLADAQTLAQEDLDAVVIPDAQDVRGNITLPDTGEINGSDIVWSASPASVITTTDTDGKRAGVVTRGETDTDVTLTASVPGTDAGREIPVTVTAAPDLDTDAAGYLWTHFEVHDGYEQIFFGHSDDGLHWSKLNDDEPILANLGGDLGVRDPHLIRSPEGDKYWIIGTDLHAEGSGPGGSGWDQLNASQHIVVWESTDLVNWSDQRIVFAGFDRAGNVWAPEAIYNEATGEYYVYWAARDQRDHETDDWALRVYVTKTRDFVTFTEPEIWASLNEHGDGQGGPNIIDSTIAKEGDTYYRFSTSDWHTIVDTAPSLDGPWTTVIGRGDAAEHGLRGSMEGLTVYELPDGGWAVMGDQSGYYGHTAETLASLEFTQLDVGSGPDEYSFEQRFRHGSVLRLTAAEEQRLLEAYGDADEPEEPGEPGEPGDPQGLVAEYTFEDGTLADGIGDADLTAHGSAAVGSDPERDQVLRLDGSSGGYAAFPTGLFDGKDELTISLDMKSERTSGNFFSFAFGQDEEQYYFLRTRGGEVRSAITQSSWQDESAVTGAVAAGEWHRYDIVFDGDTMVVYVDGVELGANSELSASVADLGSDLVGYLGRSLYSADGYFQGAYDNVRIYDVALPEDELLGHDQLVDVSLDDSAALKIDPIVSGADRTVTYPVTPGSDLTALAPTFDAASGVVVAPESGTVVDLTEPVEYTLTAEDGTSYTWTFSAVEMGSPVLPGLYADPNIAVFGDTYYIYATSDGYPGWGGKEFYVWKSTDLVDWERSEEPFLTLDGEDGNVPWASGNAWAPTVIERDGKYYFYFSGHNPTYDRKTIGVAVADDPEGPFTAEPTAMILNNEEVTSGQAIDPAAFRDPESGKYFLYWGNGSPVYAELADDMVSLVPGTIREQHGLTNYREATFVNYRDGRYHLTYSIDDTGSPNYRVGYATADSPHGPWTYQGVILEKDPSLGILGTGHNSVVNVPGTDDWFIVYHRFAIPGGNGNNRETTIDRVTFDEDGFMERVTPTLESVGPQPIAPVPSGPEVEVTAETRCVVGRVVTAVRVENEHTEPVEALVSTPHGTRSVTIGAESASSLAFSTRVGSVPAGEVTVSASAGGETSTSVTATYVERACG